MRKPARRFCLLAFKMACTVIFRWAAAWRVVYTSSGVCFSCRLCSMAFTRCSNCSNSPSGIMSTLCINGQVRGWLVDQLVDAARLLGLMGFVLIGKLDEFIHNFPVIHPSLHRAV